MLREQNTRLLILGNTLTDSAVTPFEWLSVYLQGSELVSWQFITGTKLFIANLTFKLFIDKLNSK